MDYYGAIARTEELIETGNTVIKLSEIFMAKYLLLIVLLGNV